MSLWCDLPNIVVDVVYSYHYGVTRAFRVVAGVQLWGEGQREKGGGVEDI